MTVPPGIANTADAATQPSASAGQADTYPTTTYYPTTGGSVGRLTNDVITIMSRQVAEEHASFLQGLIARESRRADDIRSAGNGALADNIQVGVDVLLRTLASLSTALKRVEPLRVAS